MGVREHGRIKTLGMISCLVGVVLGGGLAFGGPATDATIQMEQFPVSEGSSEAFAKCPNGTWATGGGFLLKNPYHRVGFEASGPLDATGLGANTLDGDRAKQWYALARHASPLGGSRTARVFAICSDRTDARIEATHETVGVARRGAWKEAQAVCPRGSRATGGGVVQSGGASLVASGPLSAGSGRAGTQDGDRAKRWYAIVRNHTLSAVDFAVFALCSEDSRATIELTRIEVDAYQTGEGRTECEGDERVTGGGIIPSATGAQRTFAKVDSSGPLDESGTAQHTETGDIPTQWSASVYNQNRSVTWRVLAICE